MLLHWNENIHSVVDDEKAWLILQSDINNHRFEDVFLLVGKYTMVTQDAQGNEINRYDKENIRTLTLREFIGGGCLCATTGSGNIEIARFSTPYLEAYRNALPKLERWLRTAQPFSEEREGGKQQQQVSSHSKGANISLWGVIREMAHYFYPYRRLMLCTAALLILSVLFEMVPPYITKLIIDEIAAPTGQAGNLLWMISGLAFAQLFGTAVLMARGYLSIRIGGKLVGDIRRDMFNALMDQSIRFFDKRQLSQFIGRIHHDTHEMKSFLSEGVTQILAQILTAGFILCMLFYLNWWLTLIVLAPLPFLYWGMMWLWPKIRVLWHAQWQSTVHIQNRIGEALQGIRVIKAFGQEQAEKNRFNHMNEKVIERSSSIQNFWLAVTPLFSLITSLFGVLIWFIGGRSVLFGEMTIGTLSAYTAYLMMFFGPIRWFSQSISWVNDAVGASERIVEVIQAPIDVMDAKDAPTFYGVGEVQFKGVCYGYEKDHRVLKDINLDIAAGEMIGIVGHSGAGKSTLMQLLCRFYDPDTGSILLDGRDLRQIRREDLRRHIGVVLQDTFLFDGTIAQNICYGIPEASVQQIIEAAVAANAHDFICRLPDGYETQVGERGIRLSGGEKQRIAIARAILLNPRVLILDEATASVDTETEEKIQQALNKLVQGRTTIAIAHRLSTLQSASRLIVIEQGEIVEVGTHQELYQLKGVYYRLLQSGQQSECFPEEVRV